jgi:hypothetical protein
VAESFPLDLARKLTGLILDAQGSGDLKLANQGPSSIVPGEDSFIGQPLTADLVRLLSSCGVMKVAVHRAGEVAR